MLKKTNSVARGMDERRVGAKGIAVVCRTGCLCLGLLVIACASTMAPTGDRPFVTRQGHQLKLGSETFRFAGIHAPELHRIEQDARGPCKADPRGWGQYFKWPTVKEQDNWIKALQRSGHRAMRIYVLSVYTPYDEACEREVHILPPRVAGGMPELNERAFIVFDRMIALAHQHDLRLIVPFIDHWKWWGGREQLAAFYGETADDFYNTESQTYRAYLHIITQVITRRNTVTGRYYRDEPAIMAWETGNELKDSTPEFVSKTAQHIKNLDANHLVVDGNYLSILPSSLEDPNVDIISNHFYTINENNHPGQVKKDLATIDGKKVYMVGEFGLKDAVGLRDIMQTVVHHTHNGAQAAGAFIWGFRGRREAGGYYWHKEYTGHYSYHLPGFVENASNEEMAVVNLVREAQAQMQGLEHAPPLPVPESPWLYAIEHPGKRIDWMGAPLGRYYRVERSESALGPWQTLATGLTDGANEYNPETGSLFKDQSPLPSGKTFFYRVFASNESGESGPSNVESVKIP